MSREFTLAAVIPDPITVRVGEKVYQGRSADMFGATELFKFEWLHDQLSSIQDHLKKMDWLIRSAATTALTEEDQQALPSDEEKESAARKLDNIVREMIYLIIPDLPQEHYTNIPYARKLGLIEFWTNEQQKLSQGEVKPSRGKVRSSTRG